MNYDDNIENYLTDDEDEAVVIGSFRKSLRTSKELYNLMYKQAQFFEYNIAPLVWEAMTSGSSSARHILNICGANGEDITEEMLGNLGSLKCLLASHGSILKAERQNPQTGKMITVAEEISDWVSFFDDYQMDGMTDLFITLRRGCIEISKEIQRIRANHKTWVNEWYEANRISVFNFLVKTKFISEAELAEFERKIKTLTNPEQIEDEERRFQFKYWMKYFVIKMPFENLQTLNMVKNTFENAKYKGFNVSIEKLDKFVPLATSDISLELGE